MTQANAIDQTSMSYSAIESDLSSPSKAKRSALLELLLQEQALDSEVIGILLEIENVPATIVDYRNKERYLEHLLKALRQNGPAESEQLQILALRHLLGSLYINFEKFWGPTIRVLFTVIEQSKFQAKLLMILLDHLKETNDFIYAPTGSINLQLIEDRPDHILHRNFIFQLMARFSYFFESHSAPFIDQFFIFVEKELLVSPFVEKFTRDDLVKTVVQNAETDVQEDIDNENIVAQDVPDETAQINHSSSNGHAKFNNGHKKQSKKSQLPAAILHKRKSRETFITVAKIIQGFKDIHKVHRQAELKNLIIDLLCCRDSSVQKAAFNCLLAYDQEQLRPYTDKILNIINDKMVRTELTLFSVDADESDQVQEKHRSLLMPVLLRILFGKMIGKIGRKSSGRDKADLRKTLVMRFVAGCTVDEILYFFKLLFDPLFDFVGVPYNQLQHVLGDKLELHNYVPLNKMQAMLSTLTAYMESVAHLKEESLQSVFKLINIITYHVITPLEDSKLVSQIDARNVEILKVLRRECLNISTNFFRMFEYYRFQQDEINFMFKHLIWTSTKGFVDRNYAHPTPLLKLIESFASNRTYHALLIKRNTLDQEEYLLRHVINLYSDSKIQRPILKFVASILADIVNPERNSSEDSDNDEEQLAITDRPILQDEEAVVPAYDKAFYKIDRELSFNQEILIGFIPIIFERLKSNCQEFVSKKDADHRIENDELLVLSALSEFLQDSEQSLLGARLLLTTLSHQKKSELILNTLKTVQVLVKQVHGHTDPLIISLVAGILSYQRNLQQRKEICNLLDLLAEIDHHLITTTRIIRLMNATSEELVDLPDLVKWNEGFRLAFDFVDELSETQVNQQEVVGDAFNLLLHQTGYIINNVDRYEFSIRENCMIFYDKLAQKLRLLNSSQNSSFLNQIIDETLLDKFIKKGLRETNDVIKHTYIGILRSLAVHCHEKNKILGEFYLFCNDNQDLDFWQNIRHIQLHNRSRALAKIVASDEISQVTPRTLSSYFMPLAAGFLFSKTYKSVSSLADNSIKLIGIICKRLNWVTYESTLSYYLELLTKANATYQRTNIKLITEILKNFNFDITACKEATQFDEENSKLEKRMKKRRGPGEDSGVISTDAPSGKRLNPSTARMVYYSVTKKLIPRLNSCLHEMTRVEFESDKAMSDYLPEKEEIKRIPMAYAIVQLLNLLPGRYVLFRDHLPTLFLKLSSFLKSKNEQVRKASRSTLIKVMNFVGPAYMPDLLRILKQNLLKGFHIHVLNYTIHSVLEKMPLKYGDLDHSVHELVNSCFHEIFSNMAEDKEIAQILAKTYEAKKTKSYDTILIVSSNISTEKLDYLMTSIKEVSKTSNEAKKVNKLSICIQKVFTGLAKNQNFPLDKLFTFLKSTIEESIPNLKIRQKIEQAEKSNVDRQDPKSGAPFREDRYLIAKDLPRDRVKSKINERGNSHMIVENCLRLLLQTLENNKAEIQKKEILQRKLDGFIALLSTCLKSSSPKCVMRSLKCIHFIAQTGSDLPSFKTKCNSIVKKIFILLSLYNGVGMVQGDNFEMIAMCFKTITLLLLRCKHTQLNDTQLRALLSYIEQDLYDTSRQATALGTLHSILQRTCESTELAELMIKIADLLVTSEDESVRSTSRKLWQTYLLKYKHEGSTLQSHLTKFLRQLDYEFIDGRKSVLKILTVIVTEFPQELLRDYFEFMFHLLASRVVNEDSQDVRSNVGRLIGLLIQRLSEQYQTHLFNKFVIPWASGEVAGLKLLGIKLISIFLESCKSLFIKNRDRIRRILSIICSALENKEDSVEEVTEDIEMNGDGVESLDKSPSTELVKTITIGDKLNYHSLRLYKRLLDKSLLDPIEPRYIDSLKKIWYNIASEKLTNWHLPVVITSCELYMIFIRIPKLGASLSVTNPNTDNYLDWNAKRIVRTLCDNYIDLLDRADESPQLLDYITQSMISLGKLIARSSATIQFESEYCKSFENNDVLRYLFELNELPNDGFVQDHLPYKHNEAKKRLDLWWLSVKVVMQARKEAALYRLSKTYRRDFVLKWSIAIAEELKHSRIAPYVVLFTMTPVRELTDKGKSKSIDSSPQQTTLMMAEKLLKCLKSLLGVEVFNNMYSKVQLHYTRKRVNRKKKEALIKVKDQARGIKRKLSQRKGKKKTKKRDKRIN